MLKQIGRMELTAVVNAYISMSPFYQDKYGLVEHDDFEALPFLSKHELLEDQKKYPPFGTNLACSQEEIIRIHRTSGTTNSPLLIAMTETDLQQVTNIGTALFKLVGMCTQDTVFNCLNYNMWMGGYTDHQSMEGTGAAIVPYGTGYTDSLIELICKMPDSSIHCTPSYLSVIKDKLVKRGLKPRDLKLRNGFFGAEAGLGNPEFRKKIENEWGIEAFNANYGISEVISILGAECSEKDGLHFGASEALYLELLNSDMELIPITPGAKGELVVTHLKKQAQPLIRYRTGDIFEIISLDSCACQFKGFKFSISGRVDQMLNIKGVNFYPESLRSIVSSYSELTGNYKVIVSKEEPINSISALIEVKQKSSIHEELLTRLIKEIKVSHNVSFEIILTEKIDFVGNKSKLLERV